MSNQKKIDPKNDPRKVAMTVTQDAKGECEVWEHDLKAEVAEGYDAPERKVATFHEDTRVVMAKGEFGPELATRDMAAIRAQIFAMTYEQLVNTGKVELD